MVQASSSQAFVETSFISASASTIGTHSVVITNRGNSSDSSFLFGGLVLTSDVNSQVAIVQDSDFAVSHTSIFTESPPSSSASTPPPLPPPTLRPSQPSISEPAGPRTETVVGITPPATSSPSSDTTKSTDTSTFTSPGSIVAHSSIGQGERHRQFQVHLLFKIYF